MLRSSPLLTALFNLCLAASLVLTSCSQNQEVLGKAYVAPESLNIRSQLSQHAGTVATLKHGDPVTIIDTQRRLVRVRTDAGLEGWVDSLELLSQEQMDRLRRERNENLLLPSEGTATAFETLNIHLEPSRNSPAFARIPEGAAVTILGRQIAPRVTGRARSQPLFNPRVAAPPRRTRKESAVRSSFRLPPKPPPPKPPANWQQLSAERIDGGTEKGSQAQQDSAAQAQATAKKSAEAKRPVIMEEWTLVKTKANEVGWALSRNLMMSIPDDVAQYAEGKHITSFFDLGAIKDEVKGTRHNWLWTTSSGLRTYDFDSWRVFLWNGRRHRYETSYRQRDVEGYFPVHVEPPDSGRNLVRTFQLITKDEDARMRRRTYLFDGSRVHLTATEEYQRDGARSGQAAAESDVQVRDRNKARPSWLRRQWNALRHRASRHD
jgi:uncharacterized protein YgiM (DUF1202 family)